jgi:hypothetical protein
MTANPAHRSRIRPVERGGESHQREGSPNSQEMDQRNNPPDTLNNTSAMRYKMLAVAAGGDLRRIRRRAKTGRSITAQRSLKCTGPSKTNTETGEVVWHSNPRHRRSSTA